MIEHVGGADADAEDADIAEVAEVDTSDACLGLLGQRHYMPLPSRFSATQTERCRGSRAKFPEHQEPIRCGGSLSRIVPR